VILGRDEQEGIGVCAVDFDIGFIPGAEIIDRTFNGEVNAVAVIGSSLRVIEDGLLNS
jgi:hypothetical protein